jgi:hypothetical protein
MRSRVSLRNLPRRLRFHRWKVDRLGEPSRMRSCSELRPHRSVSRKYDRNAGPDKPKRSVLTPDFTAEITRVCIAEWYPIPTLVFTKGKGIERPRTNDENTRRWRLFALGAGAKDRSGIGSEPHCEYLTLVRVETREV